MRISHFFYSVYTGLHIAASTYRPSCSRTTLLNRHIWLGKASHKGVFNLRCWPLGALPKVHPHPRQELTTCLRQIISRHHQMPLRVPLGCCLLLCQLQLQLPPHLRNRRVDFSFAKLKNVADKWINTQGELRAPRACLQTNGINVARMVVVLLFMQFAQGCPPIQGGSVILAVLKDPKVCLFRPFQQRETAMNNTFLIQKPTCILFFAIRDIDSTTLSRVGKHGSAVLAM